MDNREELRIELLIKECERVGQVISSMTPTVEKIIGLGCTVIATGLIFGIKEKIDEILLFLPVAVFGVFFYGIRTATETRSLGGYKRHLEEKINTILGQNILFWESLMAPNMHGSFAMKLLYFIYAFFLVLIVFISLSTAWKYYTRSTFWCMVIILLLLFIGLIISLHKLYKTFDRTYQLVKKYSEEKRVIGTSPNSRLKD